jgi:hypothetical protein
MALILGLLTSAFMIGISRGYTINVTQTSLVKSMETPQ